MILFSQTSGLQLLPLWSAVFYWLWKLSTHTHTYYAHILYKICWKIRCQDILNIDTIHFDTFWDTLAVHTHICHMTGPRLAASGRIVWMQPTRKTNTTCRSLSTCSLRVPKRRRLDPVHIVHRPNDATGTALIIVSPISISYFERELVPQWRVRLMISCVLFAQPEICCKFVYDISACQKHGDIGRRYIMLRALVLPPLHQAAYVRRVVHPLAHGRLLHSSSNSGRRESTCCSRLLCSNMRTL